MTTERVRFAPSPTGYLHIGGARTALFNWLWARKTGGAFVLRIEDTDQARSTRDSVSAILDAMRWMGMDWDEGPTHPDDLGGGPHGPYFQMKRLASYAEHAERLIRAGHAYRCYCTREELEAQKARLPEKQRDHFRYPGTCRDRRDAPDLPFVVRFKSPTDGEVRFHDLVFGDLATPNASQHDFVLLRADGVPLYNFGAVVDDVAMGITLVARGRDHIVNTPPQILLYRALDYPLPRFAHLPMMMKSKREKLSKRNGAVSVMEYAASGWTPEGLLSYLVRFGWSHGDEEVFTLRGLVERFDWEHVGKSDGIYDLKKCGAINARYVGTLATLDGLATAVVPFLAARGLAVAADDPRLGLALREVRSRAEVKLPPGDPNELLAPPQGPLATMADAMDYFFREPPVVDEAVAAKFLVPQAADWLTALADTVATVAPFETAAIKTAVEAWLASAGLEIKTVAQPARVALTGRGQSPGLYEVIAVLGRDVALGRLRAGAARARGGAGA